MQDTIIKMHERIPHASAPVAVTAPLFRVVPLRLTRQLRISSKPANQWLNGQHFFALKRFSTLREVVGKARKSLNIVFYVVCCLTYEAVFLTKRGKENAKNVIVSKPLEVFTMAYVCILKDSSYTS